MVALSFSQWLFNEERLSIDRAVVASYDRAFDAELEQAIQRCADNPPLRQSLEAMRGTRWADYIVGAILRNCPGKVDLDDAVNYIVFRMLAPIGERGERRKALFDLDPERDYNFIIGASPLMARFRTFLTNDLRSVCGGKVRRVLVSTRPPGTLTITPARKIADQQPGSVGVEEIPARPESGEKELFDDITELLQRQSTPAMPLSDLFQAILDGMPLRDQRKRFGHTAADTMRRTIKTVVRAYGDQTENHWRINLLNNVENPVRPEKRPKPAPKPKPDVPDEVRDFHSIIDVIQKAGGSASLAILASKRSRWLGRKPRDPNSTYPNRLHDVLASMTNKGVLVKRGARYGLGPGAQGYLDFEASSH
jgi:hypothetical protein